MKKQILIFTMLFALNFVHAQEKGNSIIGKWVGVDEKNQTGGIEFLKNGKAKLLMSGKETQTCDYTVDYKKSPIAVNLIIEQKGEKMTVYGLIKFINSNSIKWEIFPMAETSPKAFSEGSKGRAIVLKRAR